MAGSRATRAATPTRGRPRRPTGRKCPPTKIRQPPGKRLLICVEHCVQPLAVAVDPRLGLRERRAVHRAFLRRRWPYQWIRSLPPVVITTRPNTSSDCSRQAIADVVEMLKRIAARDSEIFSVWRFGITRDSDTPANSANSSGGLATNRSKYDLPRLAPKPAVTLSPIPTSSTLRSVQGDRKSTPINCRPRRPAALRQVEKEVDIRRGQGDEHAAECQNPLEAVEIAVETAARRLLTSASDGFPLRLIIANLARPLSAGGLRMLISRDFTRHAIGGRSLCARLQSVARDCRSRQQDTYAPCRNAPTSRRFCSSAPARSSSARPASSITPARRPARRCARKATRSCWSTPTRPRS